MSVPETLASYIDIEDVSCHTTVVTAPMGGKNVDDSFSDPWEGSVTRCICDFQHDDGYMICCDRCGYGGLLNLRPEQTSAVLKYGLNSCHLMQC